MTENPMVSIHGPGPEGKTCGECKEWGEEIWGNNAVLLLFVTVPIPKSWCRQRTLGSLQDDPEHQGDWPTCGLYKERT